MNEAMLPTAISSMTTVGVMPNGANCLSHHLRENDYEAEGEKEVNGEWIGEGAEARGLGGFVTNKPFDALRQNRHPKTGETLISPTKQTAPPFWTFSCPPRTT